MGRTNSTGPVRRRHLAALGLAALAIAGCGSDDDSADEGVDDSGTEAIVDTEANTDAEAGDAAIAGGTEDATAGTVEPSVAEAGGTGGTETVGAPIDLGRDVITTVGLTMSTTDVGGASDEVRTLAERHGGAVFRSDVRVEDPRDDGSVPGAGEIVVRIPPQDLDRFIAALDGAGRVTGITQDSEDVTEQLVDLEIRIRQAETGIERIEQLLEQATALDDVFEIETELTNRLVELERLRAAERTTDDLVALATVTVRIQYESPDVLGSSLSDGGIADALATGWSSFVGVVFALGLVLAVSAPYLLTAALSIAIVWLVGRHWSRRRAERHRVAADLGAPSPQPPPPVSDDVATPTE